MCRGVRGRTVLVLRNSFSIIKVGARGYPISPPFFFESRILIFFFFLLLGTYIEEIGVMI